MTKALDSYLNIFKLQSDVCVTTDDQAVVTRIPARLSVKTNRYKSNRSDSKGRVARFLKQG